MPCYDGQSECIRQHNEQCREEIERCNMLTDMLCRALTIYEMNNVISKLPADVVLWWEKHKKWDAERKAKCE